MPKKRYSENPPKKLNLASSQILHILYPRMSTTTGRGRLFFQAAGDPTCPSELAPKRQNPHIESSLTKNLGLASSQFFILYPWIRSIKGHYRLFRPGRRGSCGTFIQEINRRMNNLISKQNLGLASSQFWHTSEVLVISTVWCPH